MTKSANAHLFISLCMRQHVLDSRTLTLMANALGAEKEVICEKVNMKGGKRRRNEVNTIKAQIAKRCASKVKRNATNRAKEWKTDKRVRG